MKYKTFEQKTENIKYNILLNRGINNPEEYLLPEKKIQSYKDLFNIDLAVSVLLKAVENNWSIMTLVDEDNDGICSSAILFSFLKKTFPNIKLDYIIHNDVKSHGINEDVINQCIEKKIDLLIVPDAGSGNDKEARLLNQKGISVIALDHHIVNTNPENMVLVNPHLSENYFNKAISGTGVTYQFIKAIDDSEWNNYADDYLDLVALSILSDSCDVRVFENRAFLDIGLSNIKNKALLQFISKAEYGDKKIESLIDYSFSIIPLINALVRVGDIESKAILFRAFAEQYEEFDYQKKDKTMVKEDIYTRAVRLCVNAKAKQERMINKSLDVIEEDISVNNRNKNKILFALANENVEKAFAGLCAMKIAQKYNKPCVLLRDNGKDYFSGSIRNFDGSPITDLKSFLESLNSISWISGHPQAAGIGLSKKQLILTINRSNEKLENFDFSKVYNIDYEFDFKNDRLPQDELIRDILSMKFYWGMNVQEPLLLLKNIHINSSKIEFFGTNKDTWKTVLYSNKELIKFKCKDDDLFIDKFVGEFNWEGVDLIVNAIVKIGKNEFNGESKIQFIVQDYEIVE